MKPKTNQTVKNQQKKPIKANNHEKKNYNLSEYICQRNGYKKYLRLKVKIKEEQKKKRFFFYFTFT